MRKEWLLIGFSIFLFCMFIVNASVSENGNPTVLINAFDQNPADGKKDIGKEWVVLYNPSETTVNIINWSLETTHGTTVAVKIENDTLISPKGYWFYIHPSRWLDQSDESIVLRNETGKEIDRTLIASDRDNDNRYWTRCPDGFDTDSDSDWRFQFQELEKWVIRNGTVKHVIDGDTIDISPVEGAGLQEFRLVDINAPEIGTPEGEEAKEFVEKLCLGKEVEFDVDDVKRSPYGKYDRILAVVYVNGTNLNAEMLKRGYADFFYVPPSEFVPCASFSYFPENPKVGQTIAFNASFSYTLDPDAIILSYEWDFGDGFVEKGKIVNHSYSSVGNYNVTLMVTDSDGDETRENMRNRTITVTLEKFDTRQPQNPYPSIFGTHNGTIKPSHDVYVTKMYTYPCAGTGGHSEYVWIYGNGINVNATWNGYQGAGDYHYIEFSEPFTLKANVTYNYTIKTGSYPQIHHNHNKTLTVPDGKITCPDFIDANGKRYSDWIPAVRLE